MRADPPAGPTVMPGRYRVEMSLGSETITAEFPVVKDPRLSTEFWRVTLGSCFGADSQSAATCRLDLAPEGQTNDRGDDFGCGQPLEFADFGIDPRHRLP